MTGGARARLARVRAELTSTAAARYREAVDSGADPGWVRAAAVAYDSAAGVQRSVRRVRAQRGQLINALRPSAPKQALHVSMASADTGALALTLMAAAPVVDAIRLVRGSAPLDLPIVTSPLGNAQRIAGQLPAEVAEGGRWVVELLTGGQVVPIVDRAHVLPAGDEPVRLLLDDQHRLTLVTELPQPAPVVPSVSVGVGKVVLRWAGSPAVVLVSGEQRRQLLATAGRGFCTATVNLADVVAASPIRPTVWQVETNDLPMGLSRPAYPKVWTNDRVLVRTPGGDYVRVLVGWDAADRLTFTVAG